METKMENTPMRNIILAGAAALALTTAPAIAQDMDTEAYMWTDAQETMYDGWPADRQTAYDAWPANVQEYYWTLTPAQTNGWWVLNDEQRVRIYEMTPEQRSTAWTQIAAQMNGASTTATTATTASTSATTSTSPRFVRKEMSQSMPAGYTQVASGTDLPVCKANQQDGCINSWEKNRTGTKPLDYWPGRPASQMD